MRNTVSTLGAIFLSGSVLVSCSSSNNGAGGLIVNGVTLPTCELGVGEFAGCWISELCANNIEGDVENISMRLIEQAVETSTHPVVEGVIRSYLLKYNGEQCAGDPVEIIDLHEEIIKQSPTGNAIIWTYVQQPDTLCSDIGGTSSLLCNALDITVTSFMGQATGLATQLIAGERLCMPVADYNFNSTGNGGIGVGFENERSTVLNLSPGRCLNRFTP